MKSVVLWSKPGGCCLELNVEAVLAHEDTQLRALQRVNTEALSPTAGNYSEITIYLLDTGRVVAAINRHRVESGRIHWHPANGVGFDTVEELRDSMYADSNGYPIPNYWRKAFKKANKNQLRTA